MDESKGFVKPVIFLQEVRSELEKVIWPTRKQAVNLTLIVIGVSIVIGFFIGGLDYVFAKIMELLLKSR